MMSVKDLISLTTRDSSSALYYQWIRLKFINQDDPRIVWEGPVCELLGIEYFCYEYLPGEILRVFPDAWRIESIVPFDREEYPDDINLPSYNKPLLVRMY